MKLAGFGACAAVAAAASVAAFGAPPPADPVFDGTYAAPYPLTASGQVRMSFRLGTPLAITFPNGLQWPMSLKFIRGNPLETVYEVGDASMPGSKIGTLVAAGGPADRVALIMPSGLAMILIKQAP